MLMFGKTDYSKINPKSGDGGEIDFSEIVKNTTQEQMMFSTELPSKGKICSLQEKLGQNL